MRKYYLHLIFLQLFQHFSSKMEAHPVKKSVKILIAVGPFTKYVTHLGGRGGLPKGEVSL